MGSHVLKLGSVPVPRPLLLLTFRMRFPVLGTSCLRSPGSKVEAFRPLIRRGLLSIAACGIWVPTPMRWKLVGRVMMGVVIPWPGSAP